MLALAWPAQATVAVDSNNFANLSLEELGSIQVTSVSRRVERLADVAASVFVIRGDEIRRAGATTLPEALRLAPNLQVARVDARNYAITARGFNNPFANKMLVLIDGRTVYSPLFSGVFWDAQDVVLADIERIEVISGPGATVWGANAVNGVINIITRSAADTQGGLLTIGGDKGQRNGAARLGAPLGTGHYRLYAKHASADDTRNATGVSTRTGWQRSQAGFRVDLSSLTISGDAYKGDLHQAGTRDIFIKGANLLGRSNWNLGPGSDLRLQAYLDHTSRDQPNAFVEHLNTFDLDLQHTLAFDQHVLVWGGGYRKAFDRLSNGAAFSFLPAKRDLAWSNVYAQDEWRHNALRVTAGLKLERNSYTGLEHLPYLSVAWDGAANHLLWGSLARAVRVPSRIDHDLYAPSNPPVVAGVPRYGIAGGPDFISETAKVLQLGWRGEPLPRTHYAVTLYYSEYDRLRTLEPNPKGAGSAFLNKGEGDSSGIELSGSWDISPTWRISAGHVAQRAHLRAEPGSADAVGATGLANNDPASWSTLRSSHDLSSNMELDFTLRRVGALPRPVVPSYTALDIRFGWEIRPDLELSLIARNLLAADHPEFGAPASRSVYERNVFGRLTWRF
jgi:iron complex outermembrane receptor protein